MATARDDVELLTISEVASRLRVHRSTVWRLVRSNRLPAVQVTPRITRIPRRAVDAFLQGEPAAGKARAAGTGGATVEQLDSVVAGLRRFREALLARRAGRLLHDSTETLRRLREDRASR